MSIIRLIAPPGRIAGGRIVMHGALAAPARRAAASPAAALPAVNQAPRPRKGPGQRPRHAVLSNCRARNRTVRGARISMIFQEPMTSLNPVFTSARKSWRRSPCTARGQGRSPQPGDRNAPQGEDSRAAAADQRLSAPVFRRHAAAAMIAMALDCMPELLIADEPTTALDVTIQAQILDLLRELQAEVGMSILMITHDLGIVAEMADDVAVMYASKVVEYAPVAELFANPLHPYTAGLFNSRPEPGKPKDERLTTIPGMVPSPLAFQAGCKFHPRCQYCQDVCRSDEPPLRESARALARCHFAGELDLRPGVGGPGGR